MENKILTLHGVNTDMLKHYFKLSSSVGKSEVLNFSLSYDLLSGIAHHENDVFFKRWKINLTELCQQHNVPQDITLKCSIYRGSEFAKKILSYFGQIVSINFHYVNDSVKKLELFKTDEKGKIVLKITIVTAPTNTSFVEYDIELLNNMFNPAEESKLFEFELDALALAEVTKLSKLATNPEIKTDYVQLYVEEGMLKATDNSFDIVLTDVEGSLESSVDIDKSLWSMIDGDEYVFEVHSIEDKKFLCCKSKTKDIRSTLVLLSDVDDDIDFDDFDNL